MKILEKTFVKNCDKRGDNCFRQIRRDGNVCMYRRETLDGHEMEFEVFTVKVVEKGAPLPGGGIVEETYEQYPGKAAFGKSAWSIGGKNAEKAANDRFDALVKGVLKVVEAEPEVDTDETVKVARVVKGEVTLKLPEKAFSQKELAAFNGFDNYKVVYSDLQKMLASGILKKGPKREPVEGQRGKAAQLFVRA